jgi:hypothetical protein
MGKKSSKSKKDDEAEYFKTLSGDKQKFLKEYLDSEEY